jgi:hypothetical protein
LEEEEVKLDDEVVGVSAPGTVAIIFHQEEMELRTTSRSFSSLNISTNY